MISKLCNCAEVGYFDCGRSDTEHELDEFRALLRSSQAEVAALKAEAGSRLMERTAQITAHRACGGAEHDAMNGKFHGYCVVCLIPWPCEYAGKLPPAPSGQGEKL